MASSLVDTLVSWQCCRGPELRVAAPAWGRGCRVGQVLLADHTLAAAPHPVQAKLAREGRTICLTIHQPNSIITSRFEDFLLLHAGSVVYNGPWVGAVDYFSSRGLQCPQVRAATRWARGA